MFVEREQVERLRRVVETKLPAEFGGWPTRFGWDAAPVSHHVEIAPLREWLRERLGFDPAEGVSFESWLSTPQQILLEVTEGAVFHDDMGELTAARESLAWYPEELWSWLLACQWRRIEQGWGQRSPGLRRTDRSALHCSMLRAESYDEREAALVFAVEACAARHNALGLGGLQRTAPSPRGGKGRP